MLNSIRVNLLLISLFFVSASINAATYYVDQGHPSASDNNSGTESSPFLTIQKAAYVLQAGDKVFVKQGVYNEVHDVSPQIGKPGLKPQNSGTAGNPIVYEAFPGDLVVIDQQRQGNGFFISAKHYITIRGFEIRNVYGRGGVHTENNSSNITVENCHIHSIDWSVGTNVGGIRFDEVVKPIARNNIIHNIRVNGVLNGNGSGIASYGMEDAIIENNEIYDAYNGVFHKLSTGNIGALIRKNIVHDVKYGFYYDVQGGGSPSHVNQRVTQNIIYATEIGAYLRAMDAKVPNDGFHVWNNTFDVTQYGVVFHNAKNVNVYNNIVTGNPGKYSIASRDDVVSITEIDYNNFFNAESYIMDEYASSQVNYNSLSSWQSGEGYDANSTTVNPNFVNTANRDYKLSANSPLRGTGKGGVNIGAYLSDSEVIGTYFTKPSAPASLVVR